jgi:hypothetical protein
MLTRFLCFVICVSVTASVFSDAAVGASGLAPPAPEGRRGTPDKSIAAAETRCEGERANPAGSGEGTTQSARVRGPERIAASANTGVAKMFGYTQYRIRIDGASVPNGSGATAESELRFPLEVLLGELELAAQSPAAASIAWKVAVDIRKSIHDPIGTMRDSDWLNDPAGGFRGKIAFTESDVRADAFIVNVNGNLEFLRTRDFTVRWMLGYMYQNYSFEVIGLSGWMLNLQYERVYFDLFKGVNVLDYDATYRIPYLGVIASARLSRGLTVDGRLTGSPIVTAYDRDDHILRRKLIKGGCRGTSIACGVSAEWKICSPEGGPSWALRFGGEYLRVDTDGEQSQFFYGDDPSSLGDDTGLRMEGIDLKMSSRQYEVMLQFGVSF